MKPRVFCEISCAHCGGLAATGFYKNTDTIRRIKREATGWKWDDELYGNICPRCYKKVKGEKHETV